MQPHLKYLQLITASVLITLTLAVEVTGNQVVTLDALAPDDDYGQLIRKPNTKNRKTEAIQLNEEALKLSRQGRFQAALGTLEKALIINREIGDRTGEAATFNNIGRVYQSQGQYSQALKSYFQALAINREVKNPVAVGRTWSNVGFLFEQQHKPELAIFAYKQCVNSREKARVSAQGTIQEEQEPYNHTVLQTYQDLGRLLLKKNRIPEAQRIMDLIKVQELDQFFGGVRGNQQTGNGIDLMPQENQIFKNLNNSLNRAVELGKELVALRTTPPEQRNQEQKQRIQEVVEIQQKMLEEFNNFINSPEVATQVDQLSRAERRQNLDLESLNDIRDNLARLPQKSVLLYPFILNDSLELILVTPESPPIHRNVKVKREEINRTIAEFRKALQDPSRNAKVPGKQLYDWLIKPIENDLKQANAQTLVYAPDSQLRYIPLTALYDGNQWLVQRYNINHITAASLTDFNTKPREELRVLAAAFTKGRYTFNVGTRQFAFSGLPFAGEEVENLVKAVPRTTKLLNQEFTRNATVPQMDDHTIVHLATHAAFVVGKPEDSFILFGNGDRANLKDIATWSLTGVDLVVLSACETGLGGQLGNGEEILGFGYQIQKTGARAAIASLWSVDDGGTEALMNAFYATYPSGKFSKVESLRQAQIALITGKLQGVPGQSVPIKVTQRLSHPYYWAPFILIGNGL